jgi:serine/threonine-protein kinase
MSPEQVRGQPLDGRSDLFAVGVVLYEVLSGVRPFQGQSAAELSASILRENPEPLHRLREDVLPDLSAVVERALAKDVNKRYASAEEFRRALLKLPRSSEPQLPDHRPPRGTVPSLVSDDSSSS